MPTHFGKGDYRLHEIKGEHQAFLRSKLSSTSLRKLLSQHTGDIEYDIKAILSRTEIEFIDFQEEFKKLWPKLLQVECLLTNTPQTIADKDQNYYLINLNLIGQFPGNTYWIKLVTDNEEHEEVLAIIQVENDIISIFTRHNLQIEGQVQINTLKIFSDQRVILNGELNIATLTLFSYSAVIINQKDELTKLNQLEVHCQQDCELNANLTLTNLILKAGKLCSNRNITAEKRIHFITEYSEHHGVVQAMETIVDISLHSDFAENSHFHTSGMLHLQNISHDLNGTVTANYFHSNTYIPRFNGDTYVAQQFIVHAERYLDASKKSRFFLGGSVSHHCKWTSNYQGQISYHPDLKVEWQKVFSPQHNTQNKRFVPTLNLNNNLSSVPIFLPTKKSFSTNGMLSRLRSTNTKRDEKPLPQQLSLAADLYLNLTGTVRVNDATTILRSNIGIIIKGLVWQTTFFNEYKTLIATSSLEVSGKIKNSTALQIVADNKFDHNGIVESKQLAITTQNYHLEGELVAYELQLQSKEGIVIKKDSKITIHHSATISGRTIDHYGEIINSGALLLQAKKYVYKRGPIVGGQQTYVAPLFVSMGGLKAHQLNINSFLSIIGGWNNCASFNNSSLINISPQITVQSLLFPRSVSTFALTGLNIGLNIVSATVSGAAAVILPIQIGFNALARLKITAQMVKPLLDTIEHTKHNPSNDNIVRVITAVNQIIISLTYTTMSAYSIQQSLHQPASDVGFSTSEFLPILKHSAATALSLFTGYNNYAVVNISPEIFFGLGENNFNLAAINFGAMLGLSNVNNNLINVDASDTITLASSTTNTCLSWSLGDHLTLLDPYYLNAQKIFVRNAFGFHHSKWIVQANVIVTCNPTQFTNSSITAGKLVTDGGDLTCISTAIKIDDANLSPHTQFIAAGCQIVLHKLNIQSNAEAQIYSSTFSTDSVLNDGKFSFINSQQITLHQVVNNGGMQLILSNAVITDTLVTDKSFLVIDASHVAFKNLNVEINGQFQIRNSDVTIVYDSGCFVSDPDYFEELLFAGEDNHLSIQPSFIHIKTNTPYFTASFDGKYLIYETPTHLQFTDQILYSCVPIAYLAPDISINGQLYAAQTLRLQAEYNLSVNMARVLTQGDLELYANDTVAVHGSKLIGANINIKANHICLTPDLKTESDWHIRISWHGIAIVRKTETTEIPVELIATEGDVVLSSPHEIHAEGVSIHAAHKATLAAPIVYFSRSVLNHSASTIGLSVGLDIPLLHVNELDVTHFVPLLQAVKQGAQSKENISRILNGLNLSAQTMDLVNRWVENAKQHRPAYENITDLGNDMLKYLASVQVTISLEAASSHYQTLGHGDITASEIDIIADKAIFNNAIILNANKCYVKSPNAVFSGVTLTAENSSSAISLTSTYGVDGLASQVVGLSHSVTSQQYRVLPTFNVAHLEVDGHLSIDSQIIPVKSSSHGFSVSCDLGSFNGEHENKLFNNVQLEVSNNGHEEQVAVPVFNSEGLQKFSENLTWLTHKLVNNFVSLVNHGPVIDQVSMTQQKLPPTNPKTTANHRQLTLSHDHDEKTKPTHQKHSSAGSLLERYITEAIDFPDNQITVAAQNYENKYASAVASGVYEAVVDTFTTSVRLLKDVVVLSAASNASNDGAFAMGQCVPSRFDCKAYEGAKQDLHGRWDEVSSLMRDPMGFYKQIRITFANASGPEKTKMVSEVTTAFLLPEGIFRVGKMLARCSASSLTLYRGDSRDPDFIFKNGFNARGKNLNLLSHVTNDASLDSAYISTSTSKEAATLFPWVSDIKYSYVYEINSYRPPINVVAYLTHEFNLGDIHPEDFEIIKSEYEKAFVSKIYSQEIKGAWQVIIEPDDFPPGFIHTQEPLDDICNVPKRTIQWPYIANSHYGNRPLIIARPALSSIGGLYSLSILNSRSVESFDQNKQQLLIHRPHF